MKTKYILPFMLAINVVILFFEISGLSLSYREAHTFFGYHGVAGYLSHIFVPWIGQNDFSVRLPMVLLHIASVFLLYQISRFYLKKERNRLILVAIYMSIPGVISAALLIHDTGFVIFALMLFIYLYKKFDEHIGIYIYLVFLTFLGHPFFYLFSGLFVYAVFMKKRKLAVFTFSLGFISFVLYGSDVGGPPTGHFLDALAIYSAIFSPIVFIFLVYSLYRIALTKKLDFVWFLSTTALIFSLLLSLRQRVHLEIYAPYLLPGLVFAAQIFESSYRVRLPLFRKRYKLLFNIAIAFLILNIIAVLSNKYLYKFIDNPKKHFAYKNHIAKELAWQLKRLGIDCVKTDYKMQMRLNFYGIKECKKYKLIPYRTENSENVTISYNNKPVFQTYVTKLNKK